MDAEITGAKITPMGHEQQHPAMTDQLARQWIEWVRMGSKFYEAEIGRALERNDVNANDFLERAKRLDPGFVRRYYPGFLE